MPKHAFSSSDSDSEAESGSPATLPATWALAELLGGRLKVVFDDDDGAEGGASETASARHNSKILTSASKFKQNS